ncbi:UNVERIFIED_CONTAM: hypothetical protein FKN15_013977 [Acipenser sinensis]
MLASDNTQPVPRESGYVCAAVPQHRRGHYANGGRFSLTSNLIHFPDDCTVGYIVERLLGVPLLRSQLFHSHMENLQLIAPQNLRRQVRGAAETRVPVECQRSPVGLTDVT